MCPLAEVSVWLSPTAQRTCDLTFRASPLAGHRSLAFTRGFSAFLALLLRITCTSPSSRQRILGMTPGLGFLRNPSPYAMRLAPAPVVSRRGRTVMYLQQTDNTRVRKSGKIAPFHPHVRGLHHGIHPNFLQTSPGLSSLAVLHAPCAVARHPSGNAPHATHSAPTTAQASQSPQTLCR